MYCCFRSARKEGSVEFDSEHKCKWWLINKEEATEYIEFLVRERERHCCEMVVIEVLYLRRRPKSVKGKARKELWASAFVRHHEDIKGIDQLITQVKHWFEL